MHLPNDSRYSHARASGIVAFTILQVALISAGAAWAWARVGQLDRLRAMPVLREVPLEVKPRYDYPVVVSNDQLSRVLTKLRPKNFGAKTKLNNIDHALRFWTPHATFADPKFFSGEQLRAIITDNREFVKLYGSTQPPLLIDGPFGVRVRLQEGMATSSHVDHTVAGLAEVGTPLDFPVITPTHVTNYRAMIDQALHDFNVNQVEYEWTALALALFMPPNQVWIDTEGQQITFDLLSHRLMREDVPRGVCFGNHRLHTLATFLRIDEQNQILSPAVRAEIIAFLIGKTQLLVKNQHADGYWDAKWPLRPAGSDPKDNASGDAVADRILATGHALEWWATAPAECHPPRETIAKAGQWTAHTIEALTSDEIDRYYTFLTHAGRALSIWRGKYPYEVKLDE